MAAVASVVKSGMSASYFFLPIISQCSSAWQIFSSYLPTLEIGSVLKTLLVFVEHGASLSN